MTKQKFYDIIRAWKTVNWVQWVAIAVLGVALLVLAL
jgi:hypothetical protein